MSLYSDRSIRMALKQGDVRIEPYNEAQLQPASYDVRLDDEIMYFGKNPWDEIDPRKPPNMKKVKLPPGMGWRLQPGHMILASTIECLTVSSRVAARVEGKSSLGRLGLLTHVTAGFIDPGFSGHVTLELANVNSQAILLYPGMKIGQICLFSLTTPVSSPYGEERGSHYQGQRGPTASKAYLQFEEKAS